MHLSSTGRLRAARATRAAAAAAVAVLGLAGCGSSSTGGGVAPPASTSPAAATTTGATAAAAPKVTVSDTWVKSADSGMTAMFGVLKNTGSTAVTVVSATSDAAEMLELHEVVMVDGTMKMQPRKDGFAIPAGGTHELTPGGDHVMLMGLKKPVRAGDPVTVVLSLSDGSKITVNAVGKDFSGANETYQPTPGMSGPMTSGM